MRGLAIVILAIVAVASARTAFQRRGGNSDITSLKQLLRRRFELREILSGHGKSTASGSFETLKKKFGAGMSPLTRSLSHLAQSPSKFSATKRSRDEPDDVDYCEFIDYDVLCEDEHGEDFFACAIGVAKYLEDEFARIYKNVTDRALFPEEVGEFIWDFRTGDDYDCLSHESKMDVEMTLDGIACQKFEEIWDHLGEDDQGTVFVMGCMYEDLRGEAYDRMHHDD